MADVPITPTCADYARVMPLATGDVKPDGIALTLIQGTGGSWEMRAEMLRRALNDPTVQGGEASMAGISAVSTRATAAISGCQSSRCATSPREISMCSRAARSGPQPISSASGRHV